jgi:hypothetical protein
MENNILTKLQITDIGLRFTSYKLQFQSTECTHFQLLLNQSQVTFLVDYFTDPNELPGISALFKICPFCDTMPSSILFFDVLFSGDK